MKSLKSLQRCKFCKIKAILVSITPSNGEYAIATVSLNGFQSQLYCKSSLAYKKKTISLEPSLPLSPFRVSESHSYEIIHFSPCNRQVWLAFYTRGKWRYPSTQRQACTQMNSLVLGFLSEMPKYIESCEVATPAKLLLSAPSTQPCITSKFVLPRLKQAKHERFNCRSLFSIHSY